LRPNPVGGESRVGEVTPTTLGALARLAKAQLAAACVQIVGDPARPVKRVAVACGAAGEFLPDAARAGADAFLTGEMRFHDCATAAVGVILPGHYATERPGVE